MSLCLWQLQPPIELSLREASCRLDAWDMMGRKRCIAAFCHERDLVLQIGKAIVHRSG